MAGEQAWAQQMTIGEDDLAGEGDELGAELDADAEGDGDDEEDVLATMENEPGIDIDSEEGALVDRDVDDTGKVYE
jgi:DNA-directed RNA polymerase subunit omega